MTPGESEQMVNSIGAELVARLAPEEVPLYPAMVKQFTSGKGGQGKTASRDQILGFGVGEAMTMLTPVILEFSRSFWSALISQAAQSAVHGIVLHLQALRPGGKSRPADAAALTADQLRLVRTIAEEQAHRLKLSDRQAGLLADAVVGVLAVSPAQ